MTQSLLSLQSKICSAVETGKLRIILASASPRRSAALATMLGNKQLFEIIVSDFAEDLPHSEFASAVEYNMATAKKKAEHVNLALKSAAPKTLIIAADTVVALHDHILEKPSSAADAARMLRLLSDTEHQIHTSVVLRELPENIESFAFTSTVQVKFAKLNEEEIAAYVATGEAFDKAGAYEIQGQGRMLVEHIAGDFFSAVGFPAREFALHFARLATEL